MCYEIVWVCSTAVQFKTNQSLLYAEAEFAVEMLHVWLLLNLKVVISNSGPT